MKVMRGVNELRNERVDGMDGCCEVQGLEFFILDLRVFFWLFLDFFSLSVAFESRFKAIMELRSLSHEYLELTTDLLKSLIDSATFGSWAR